MNANEVISIPSLQKTSLLINYKNFLTKEKSFFFDCMQNDLSHDGNKLGGLRFDD